MARAGRGIGLTTGVAVVLVRPEAPVNVGSAARAMRNAGLRDLRLVQAGDWRTVECWRTAWGAQDVLEGAREFEDLRAAVADAAWTAAFSGKTSGRGRALDVREAAAEAVSHAGTGVAALVFGPETSGLTDAEVDLCGRRALIPAHPAQPSLNLAQAVMVACYEVLRAPCPAATGAPPPASHGDVQAMLDLLRVGLLASGALPAARAEAAFQEWVALFQRAGLSPREVRLLAHMARRMAAPPGDREP